MQVARPTLPPLNIELAQRKPLQTAIQKSDDVSADTTNGNVIEAIPPTPLSPPTFLSKIPAAAPEVSPAEILLLNERYLLLECIEGAVSPQSQPLRRCIDTVTEETYFCRECSTSPSTATLLEAHHRLRDSAVVTPVCHVIHAEGDAHTPKLYLLSPASYGDLHSYLRSKRRLKENEARNLFRQAAQAVFDCHKHGVVLTDLKLRRFVFADPQRSKLRLESLEEAIVLERSDSDDGVWRKHGYPAYVTPEVLLSRGARYSGRAADLWSLGIILYTLLVGRYPFQDSGPFGLFTKIIRGHFTVPDFVSSRARCLIRHLLRRDPCQRLEAADILRHPWFNATLRTAKVDQVKSKPEATGNGAIRPELSVVDQVVPEALVDSRMED
ncbi:tribbles homolog 2-like [Daphnia carinata]|uniref:tribbles homolog 2-like n=1 Tax=Daphnia carinata TaxID=120202 RepID=UPI00257C2E27|nr:tribbles homolog 2-like [Daphnia carinata]